MSTQKIPFAQDTVTDVLDRVKAAHPDRLDYVRALRRVRHELNEEIKNEDPKAVAQGVADGLNNTDLGAAIGASHSHVAALRKTLQNTPADSSTTAPTTT